MKRRDDDTPNDDQMKWTMGLISLLAAGLIAAIDSFAFQAGARATISQVWLALNRRCWALTYILAILVGILLQHVSVARDLNHGVNPPFWRQALLWTPFFWLGLWLGYRFLYQLPNVD